ncbi:MAG: endolytic transglycosylase MltG [Bacillaceae bacterium]
MNKKEKDYFPSLEERTKEAKTVRKVVVTVTLIVVAAILAVGIAVYFYISSSLKPIDKTDKTKIKVTIPLGSTASSMGAILEEKGLIKNDKVFRYYIKFKNESGFQAGDYQLSKSMDLKEIIKTLKSGTVGKEAVYKVTIPEGKTLDQIAKILAERAKVNETTFLKTVDDEAFIKKMQEKYPTLITNDVFKKDIKHPLEGYLFPATYEYFEKDLTIEEVVEPMLKKAQDVVGEYLEEIKEKKFTVHQALTLASLIEEEATGFTDRQRIASVFYNRFEKGMPLQTDPTVLYALGKHKDRVLYKDLEVDSPYNTYKVKGLTPGPIANAGEASLKAALNPAKEDYLYFLADSSGKVYYAKTLEEHNALKAKHITKE